jgi:methyl-accepting chemotaxis protein
VRTLAQRSADAAKQIRQLIQDSSQRIASGTVLADKAGATMHDIVREVTDITQRIREISVASSEQASSVGQISIAMNTIEATTQQNAALVEQSAVAAKELEAQAHLLESAVGFFRIETKVAARLPASVARKKPALLGHISR